MSVTLKNFIRIRRQLFELDPANRQEDENKSITSLVEVMIYVTAKASYLISAISQPLVHRLCF